MLYHFGEVVGLLLSVFVAKFGPLFQLHAKLRRLTSKHNQLVKSSNQIIETLKSTKLKNKPS
jgi:hypothetical protein